MTRLFLVRHGEAQSAVDGVVGGPAGCSGLSELGRRQAEALRDRLDHAGSLGGVDALYASTLPRAVQTAEIISPAIGGLEPEQDCDLCELHVGEAVDGQPWEEIRERYPWPVDAFTPWSPGAESWAEFAWRVARRLRRLIEEHQDQTVVVACHGGIVDTSFFALGGVGIDQSRPPGNLTAPVQNTSLTEWALTDEGRWTLVRFNDAAHLEGLDH